MACSSSKILFLSFVVLGSVACVPAPDETDSQQASAGEDLRYVYSDRVYSKSITLTAAAAHEFFRYDCRTTASDCDAQLSVSFDDPGLADSAGVDAVLRVDWSPGYYNGDVDGVSVSKVFGWVPVVGAENLQRRWQTDLLPQSVGAAGPYLSIRLHPSLPPDVASAVSFTLRIVSRDLVCDASGCAPVTAP